MSLWSSATFCGVALPSWNPKFVDKCLRLVSPGHWTDVGPITLHISPESVQAETLHASFAWRNEHFATVYPDGEAVTVSPEKRNDVDAAHCVSHESALEALAQLLGKHIERQERDREKQAQHAAEARTALSKILSRPAVV